MALYTPDQAKPKLEEIASMLQTVHYHRDTDSIKMANRNMGDLRRVERDMGTLVFGVQPEHYVRLTVGSFAVDFDGQAWRKYRRAPEKLEAGSTLVLKQAEEIWDSIQIPPELCLYVGDYSLVVKLALVGEVLSNEGGGLDIIESDRQVPAA
ncbi:MAG TPA: hypothetical protein VMR18_03555 [Candidatus Saccharimonadales bacterium]|jgi:hypothetical protein|nr:hypothetical protein [Candidatus Saccharimonadales bacterium]